MSVGVPRDAGSGEGGIGADVGFGDADVILAGRFVVLDVALDRAALGVIRADGFEAGVIAVAKEVAGGDDARRAALFAVVVHNLSTGVDGNKEGTVVARWTFGADGEAAIERAIAVPVGGTLAAEANSLIDRVGKFIGHFI